MRVNSKKERGEIDPDKKINNKLLFTEYWKQHLEFEMLQVKDKGMLLTKSPVLTQNDYRKMIDIVQEEKSKQFFWAVGCSAFTFGIYSVFWAKKSIFYNYYRKPHKSRIVNLFKRSTSLFSLLVLWTVSLNYFFNTSIPSDYAKQQFFRKYAIEYEESNY